jgi:hypothetical protein
MERPTRPPDAPSATWRAAAALSLLPYLLLVARFNFMSDDAYISFRYARQLAEGHGLVFNVGDRVEGYTNLLWVLWLTPFERMHIDLALVSRLTSVASGIVLLALMLRLVERRLQPTFAVLTATGLFFALLPPVAVWSTSGLETMPFALAYFGVFERLALDPERPRGVQAGLWGAAAVLLRADGAAWVLILIALAALSWTRTWSTATMRGVWRAVGVVIVVTAVHVAWRHSYYGEWLPNTALVKGGFSMARIRRGIVAMAAITAAVPWLAVVPVAALALARRPPLLAVQALGVLACAVAVVVEIGGDFMAMGRMLVPAMPFLAILAATLGMAIVRRVEPAASRQWVAVAVMVPLLVVPSLDGRRLPNSVVRRLNFRYGIPPQTEVEFWRGMRDRAAEGIELGAALRANTTPGESLILGRIGAVGYTTDLVILDVFGLVDREVARQPTSRTVLPGHDKEVEPDFFMGRRPTYYAAFLTSAETPEAEGLPKPRASRTWANQISVERHAWLPDASGRPRELRLLRLHWN